MDDPGGCGGTDSDQEGGAGIFGPVASLTVRTLGHACDIAHGGSILWRSASFGDDDATSAIAQRSGMGVWCVCARTCCRTSSSAARAPATRSCEHAQKDPAEDVHMHMAIAWKGCMGARRVCGGRGAAQASVRTARAASPSPHPCAARWAQDGASGIIALVRRLGPAGLTGDTLVSYQSSWGSYSGAM